MVSRSCRAGKHSKSCLLYTSHSSYVVVDPKGGTLAQCGYFLQKKKGYKVKVFNSIDFSKSMHYNPMAYIKTESDVLKFVNALIANTKGDGKEGDEMCIRDSCRA